ncbi:MAG: MFS transporter [Gemmatimonadota bacterium]|nr:MAG: MFS transporter [Gemmatimonadota bacterium]
MERYSDAEAAGWVPVALFFVANILFGAGLFSHAFLYNFYLDELRLGESVMGLAAATLTAGGLAALLPAGIVVDRLGTAVAFLVAATLAVAGLVAGAFVTGPLLIYAAAFLAGAGTATWRVAMGPILLQLARPAMRARAFSWNVALLVGSGAAWTAASGALPGWSEALLGVDRLSGIRVGLVLGAGGTALSAAVFFFANRGRLRAGATAERGPVSIPAILQGLRIPAALLTLVVLVALWMSAAGLVIPFFNLYFLREHGLPLDRIGLIFAVSQAAAAVVIFGSGEVASRLGPRRTLAAWMLLFAPALWMLAAASAVELAILLFLVQGLVPPATNPLIDQILLERAPPRRRGAVSSWRNAATDVSGFVGATAGGAVLELGSFDGLFALAGGLGLLGAMALIIGLKRLTSQ